MKSMSYRLFPKTGIPVSDQPRPREQQIPFGNDSQKSKSKRRGWVGFGGLPPKQSLDGHVGLWQQPVWETGATEA
jgi:hypothetical protein